MGSLSNILYVGCGTGTEPGACNQEGVMASIKPTCVSDPRAAWRSFTLRFDVKGNLGWYRQDNFVEAANLPELATSANEYVASYGNRVMAMVDEQFGFGVTEYVDSNTGVNCP